MQSEDRLRAFSGNKHVLIVTSFLHAEPSPGRLRHEQAKENGHCGNDSFCLHFLRSVVPPEGCASNSRSKKHRRLSFCPLASQRQNQTNANPSRDMPTGASSAKAGGLWPDPHPDAGSKSIKAAPAANPPNHTTRNTWTSRCMRKRPTMRVWPLQSSRRPLNNGAKEFRTLSGPQAKSEK